MNNSEKGQAQRDRIMRYASLIQKQAGRAIRPYRFDSSYREDGYVNVLNRYGTSKDTTEQYHFEPEPTVEDNTLTSFYEGNGLFAKIIDTPAEEAVKHGFTLEDIADKKIENFYREAYEELDGDEMFMTGIKWARLFGGSIAVMMINDGRGIDEPLDWSNIQSIDDIRVYDRSLIQPDYSGMFSYDPRDPFRTRGSRLGMPEYYYVTSKYGSFTVHDSRCLVFQNGILPENCSNSTYQMWGMPEYIRLKRAIRDAELAHSSAPKMLDRSVQAIYKMKDLAATLATEQGEEVVLKRLQVIDLARGLLNSITIDSENEDYDFKQFQFSGVSEIIDKTCAHLSALTNIPQAILFGSGAGGLSSTDDTSMESWYNYCERIQRRMIKSNLRYLMSIIFQAGVATGEIDEVPPIKVNFNPLWSLSETEQVDLEQKRAQVQQTKATTANTYVTMGAIDPSEVRKKLADSEEFDVENMLDDLEEEDLTKAFEEQIAQEQVEGEIDTKAGTIEEGNSPDAAPAATKLPQDMNGEDVVTKEEEEERNQDDADTIGSVGVLVVQDGKILCGTRHNDFGYGLVCGPGGHVEDGETTEAAAIRETQEEFGIKPKNLIPLGFGPEEPDTKLTPMIYLCTEYEGEPECVDLEIANPQFCTLEELNQAKNGMFQPFADSLKLLGEVLFRQDSKDDFEWVWVDEIGAYMIHHKGADTEKSDGGPGSGNFGHEGVKGQLGGSAPSSGEPISKSEKDAIIRYTGNNTLLSDNENLEIEKAIKKAEPLDGDCDYTRGVAFTKQELSDLIKKGYYEPDALTSWSNGEGVAEGFAYEKAGDEKFPVVLCYRGTKELNNGIDVTEYSQHPDEFEAIFSSGIKMKIDPSEIYGFSDEDEEPSGTVYINLYDGRNDSLDEQNQQNRLFSENPIDKSANPSIIKSKDTTNEDYGVPGMKWGERKEEESEQEGVKKTKVTQFKTENGTMKVTGETKARLGSKGSARIMEGDITEVAVFAGKGGKKPLELADKFAHTYGGKPEDWTHSTGNGKIKLSDGTEKNAEIHWFECEGIGQTKWKIKKFKKG